MNPDNIPFNAVDEKCMFQLILSFLPIHPP